MSAADRLALLRRAVREGDEDEWTTCRVERLYQSYGHAAPKRKTARDDLARFARRGLLVLDDTDRGRRVFRRARVNGGQL
ncbi:hypothetical protein ABT282_15785 [Streptomyces sp. NPDC000927]|uniref:hypothetical protein n=1 Tax=Streptomyces sp. NPDC000927 TaxID=3154371 RepID=UPI00332743E0